MCRIRRSGDAQTGRKDTEKGGKGKELRGQRSPSARNNTMDDKDRTIVTFGGDDREYTSSPKESVSMDVDIPQDVTPETRPYEDTVSGANTGDFLEDYGQYTDRYEAEHSSADAASDAGASSGYTPAETPAQTYSRPVRDPRYVTKGALAMCMVITMIVSSLLGAFLGGAFSRSGLAPENDSAVSSEESGSDSSSASLSEATGSDLTISQIVDMNADSVVEILVSGTARNYFGQMQVTEGAGSGVILREDGYIVTNYHVIKGANKVQVTLHNGETYPAAIVGGDNDNDIAIIKINAKDLKVAKVGDSSTVSVGDTAVAIGNPLGQLGGTATTGIISALDRNLEIDGRTLKLMQTDAAINGGNSGGGLFNGRGELIGIVDAKSSGVGIEGLAFAIPINAVIDTINDIIENGSVTTRPVVGITIADVSEENAQYYQLEKAGVYISQVTGQNAQRAGFQAGDRIVSFEGKSIETSQQFITAVKEHKAGDTVSVVVDRSGQEIEIKTVLEEYTSTEG